MKSESNTQDKSRRNFLSKLAVGSVSGLIVGASATAAAQGKKDMPIILQDPNTCRGLNTCKGKGKREGGSRVRGSKCLRNGRGSLMQRCERL